VTIMSVAKFERFFRSAASLEVDKADLKRYSDFVQRKTYDLLLMAEAKAKANGQSARREMEPFDLPITKRLQENIHALRRRDDRVEPNRFCKVLRSSRSWTWLRARTLRRSSPPRSAV